MIDLSPELKRLAKDRGFSLDPQSERVDEWVLVYKGSVLRGAPVGQALSLAGGILWQASGYERGTDAIKDLGKFQTVDDAILEIMHRSQW